MLEKREMSITGKKMLLVCVISFVVIVGLGLLSTVIFEVCPMCCYQVLTKSNGHFHKVQGNVIELAEDAIVLEPTGFSKLHFFGKTVVLVLPTVSTSGMPENLDIGDTVTVAYNQSEVVKEKGNALIEIVFWISKD